MMLLIVYWSFMAVGYALARRMAGHGRQFSWITKAMMLSVYGLCVIMGLRMGVNEQVTSNLGTIGLISLFVTVFCIAGSMTAIFLMRMVFKMDRYGNIRKKANESTAEETGAGGNKLDLKSTFVILALVTIGMVVGALVIARYFDRILPAFEYVSGIALTVLLCVLLFFVGFDLGAAGTLLSNFKNVGLRVIGFPFAAVIGTALAGTAACMAVGFSMKEGIAISIGFGWYTYAPVVIAGAGQQYMIASAVSFMYNVIRETAGIVFIPVIAKKIGYLEATGVPGVAAMDVCMPIVERSCRRDTVIYSFATGLLMCIVTSIGVPLVMGS